MNKKLKISIFGTGYVGLTIGLCLAKFGYNIIFVDIDKERIKNLQSNKIPIFEEGIFSLLKKNKSKIEFTIDYKKAIKTSNIIFIAVGTPYHSRKGLDLSAVKDVAQKIAKNIATYKIIVNKSTVPVGTAKMIEKTIDKKYKGDFSVVSNPEFLREGKAVSDFLHPDRIVIGGLDKKAQIVVVNLYKKIKAPIVLVDNKSAEMIKYVSNAFLATKISFINEIANLCEQVGADIDAVREGIKYDPRIGDKFFNPGIGYGGSCFPKDTHALAITADRHGHDFHLLKSVIEVNKNQRKRVVEKARKILGGLVKKNITILGLAFKGNSDDVRESVSISLIKDLKKFGAKIKAYDPQAMNNAKLVLSDSYDSSKPKEHRNACLPTRQAKRGCDSKEHRNAKRGCDIMYIKNVYESIKNSELLIIATEWDQFKKLDFIRIKKLMKKPNIIDGRNLLDKEKLRKLGFSYYGIGRK
jgi:UDPglucose 6-dehydrogenase